MTGPGPGPDGGRNCLWGPDPPEKRRGVAGRRCAPSCPSRCCSLLLLQEGTGGHASASAVPTLLRVRVRFSTAWIVFGTTINADYPLTCRVPVLVGMGYAG